MAKKSKGQSEKEYVVALAGNPNVGKSTVFNSLTGLHQHTGNWAGKTVENARGRYCFKNEEYTLVDLPGTYSLFSKSFEEKCAEEFLSFGEYDAVAVITDANCLERNLNLVLQIQKITDNVIVGVNLMDEAEKNGVKIDFDRLTLKLGVPVVPMSAGKNRGMDLLKKEISKLCRSPRKKCDDKLIFKEIQSEIKTVADELDKYIGENSKNDYYALRILYDSDYGVQNGLFKDLTVCEIKTIREKAESAQSKIYKIYGCEQAFCDAFTDFFVKEAEKISKDTVSINNSAYKKRHEKLDRIFMGKYTGLLTMILLFVFILWLTVYGANYPSELLSSLLLGVEDDIASFLLKAGVSDWLVDMFVHGAYRVLAWVVSVMLPPMAIFFPLFTILEDFGYLPRVAFNLDYYFQKANTCGKQALTMCMGFGCNAVGVTGCRIIDSPRERLIAIVTNSLVPCNGRFPTLITLITMFFICGVSGFAGSVLSAVLLCATIIFGISATLLISKILSKTLLRGVPSSFTLELPPFRKPQFTKVIVRSVFDRTLFVLGRAVSVAFPAGIVIWIMANVTVGDSTLLSYCTHFLDPLGRILGMDGVILTAFVLGFPANEIVLPIILMAYMQGGTLSDYSSLSEFHNLLVANGWSISTALCVIVFSLMHWPCSTTLLTIKKETHSLKWTLLSFIIPTLCGMTVCFLINILSKIFV